jgi:hypothetical protein
MPQNEIIYRTNIDLHETITRLREIPSVKINYETGMSPPGIAQLYFGKLSCRIGAKGGVQIHYDHEKELKRFLKILKSNASYVEGKAPVWIKTKQRAGISVRLGLAARVLADIKRTVDAVQELFEMPGIDDRSSMEDRVRFITARHTRLVMLYAQVGFARSTFRSMIKELKKSR